MMNCELTEVKWELFVGVKFKHSVFLNAIACSILPMVINKKQNKHIILGTTFLLFKLYKENIGVESCQTRSGT